jgi:multidrug efflux pump subunit AcrA (membrane-fusion protein)
LSLGTQAEGFRVVLAGLKEGERVVTEGQARLHNKARVTIQSAPPAAAQTR